MALFAAIGDRFIAKILRQVASDYNLDYEEMKTRYCGDTSFELSMPTKDLKVNQLTVDLEETKVVPKAKAPKVSKPKAVKVPKAPNEPVAMALSKMKKPDLVRECEERDLDSEGTVAQLKDRVKEAREASGIPSKKKGAPKSKEPKAVKVKSPPPPVVLEEEEPEEEEEEPDSPGGIRARQLRDREEEEEEEEEEPDDLQDRLRKILAEAEEEEFDEED